MGSHDGLDERINQGSWSSHSPLSHYFSRKNSWLWIRPRFRRFRRFLTLATGPASNIHPIMLVCKNSSTLKLPNCWPFFTKVCAIFCILRIYWKTSLYIGLMLGAIIQQGRNVDLLEVRAIFASHRYGMNVFAKDENDRKSVKTGLVHPHSASTWMRIMPMACRVVANSTAKM